MLFSITCELCSSRRIMQNLLYTLPSLMSRTSQEASPIFQKGGQVTLLVCDWRISIHFACFCFWMTVTTMIDGSVKRNRKFGFELQSSHVIEKRYNPLNFISGIIRQTIFTKSEENNCSSIITQAGSSQQLSWKLVLQYYNHLVQGDYSKIWHNP